MSSLLKNIDSLRQNDRCHQTIKYLYEYCFRIALKSITKKYGSERHIFSSSELTFESLATDALAPLFTRSSDDEPIGLLRSLLLWESPVETDENADFFLHKVVWNRIAQHITRMLKETDPLFKKIHSSLKYYIDKNEFNKLTYFGTVYITEKNITTITSNVIHGETFENLPDYLFFYKYEEMLSNLITHLEVETDFFPAIPLNALVRKLKFINRSDFESSTCTSSYDYIQDKLEIETIIENAYLKTCENLDRPNKKNSKLDKNVIIAFKSVLKDVTHDMKNGGMSRGLFEYFSFYMKDLTKEEFYANYHPQLNYLISLFKKSIADQITEK